MTKYKIFVSIDGDNFFWIVVDNGRLIKNPIEEDLRRAKRISYNKTNICHICRKENEREGKELAYRSMLYPGNVLHETDKDGNKIDKWICRRHGLNSYERYDHNSHRNIKKSLGNCRTNNQDRNSSREKGDKFQKLSCELYNAKDLNKENDNYNSPIDHVHKELGYFQTKGKLYDPINRCWKQMFENEHGAIRRGFKFDILIFYCVSKDGKKIERIYILPVEEIIKRTGITIYKNNLCGWYEKYRVADGDTLNKVNEIWQKIINGDKE